jgi:NDP-sugar pyrophosphorylase family protein
MKSKISITISNKLLNEIDNIIDNIYIRNRSQAIEQLIANSLGENRIAVILSGGKEENLKISKTEYRLTAKIGKSTLIEEAIKNLRKNNFKTIYIIACKNILTETFSLLGDGLSYGVKINYIEDKEPKGNANSLKLLKGKIKSNFLIVYGDIYFNKINIDELWNSHLRHNAVITLMLTSSATPNNKGVVKIEGNKILNFIQKPKKTDIYIGFSSIFVSGPEIFESNGNFLEKDVFPIMADKGMLNGHFSSEKEVHIHSKEDVKKIKF